MNMCLCVYVSDFKFILPEKRRCATILSENVKFELWDLMRLKIGDSERECYVK